MKIDDVLESMDGSRPINIPENTENREIFWTLYRGLQAWKKIQDEIKTRRKAIVDAGEADREFTEAKVIIYDGMLDMIGRYIKEIEMGKESVAIHLYVPICPNCGGALKYYEGTHNFFCHCCKSSWGIKGSGQTDRELICERRDENADD